MSLPENSNTEIRSKTVVRRDIEMIGKTEGKEACGNCIEEHDTFHKEILPSPTMPIDYKHTDIDSDRGLQLEREKKIKYMPYTIDCPVYDDGTKGQGSECREIEGWKKSDWTQYKKPVETNYKHKS